MRLRTIGISAVFSMFASMGCSSTSGPASDGSPTPPPGPPPAPVTEHPACIISADCPSGAHCDLGQCIQDCNTIDPCTGQASCSPRGRCLSPNQPDADPKPTTQHAGEVSVATPQILITGSDAHVQIDLKSTSSKPVRYRVEPHAAYLSVATPRGTFTGSTALILDVDRTKVTGTSGSGDVKIFTELGDVSVSCPIQVGVTGMYVGVQRYDGGPVALGEARIALNVLEQHGDVSVQVDPKASLLFPDAGSGATTGHGTYSDAAGLEVTLSQLIPASFGGDRNHFQRPIGRRVHMVLKRGAGGLLSGTFDDTLYDEFRTPVTTTGTVALQLQTGGHVAPFTVAQDPPMPVPVAPDTRPVIDRLDAAAKAIFGWTASSEVAVGCFYAGGTCDDPSLTQIESQYAGPLERGFLDPLGNRSSKPFVDIATECAASLAQPDLSAFQTNAGKCTLVPGLAESVMTRTTLLQSDHANAQSYGRAVRQLVEGPLLVAKNDIVLALTDSFAAGRGAEGLHYDAAMAALSPTSTWLMQLDLLEFMRSMDPNDAKGPNPTKNDTVTDTFAGLRSTVDVLTTEAFLDGERARVAAAAESGLQPNLAALTQQRATLGYLESSVVTGILQAWKTVPPSVGAKFLGMLTPLNRGFAALSQGANVYGISNGFVPFVFRPEDVGRGATNFEQMLNTIAANAVGAEVALEQAFTADKRTYEMNAKDLQTQLTSVRSQFDSKIRDACGQDVDVDVLTPDAVSTTCARGKGSIGGLMLSVDEAVVQLQASQSAIEGGKAKIGIEVQALAASQQLRAADIQFIDSTGTALEAVGFADDTISAEQSAVQVASNANVMNGGAPLGEAVVTLVLGLEKAALDLERTRLQTMQQVHSAQTTAAVEYVNGMAQIQKDEIDLAQQGVNITLSAIKLSETQLQVSNALDDIKAMVEERGRVLGILSKDPSTDPSYRLLRDEQATQVLKARDDAQKQLSLAAKALEYELNMSIDAIDGAVLNAHNGTSLNQLSSCLLSIFNASRVEFGTPQDYVTTVSVRKMLGITGPRKDDVTGETLSEGEQFRELLLRNENIDGDGGVGIEFSTDLMPGNQLWSTDVCNDRIVSMQAQLVGDFLGDNQAQVNLSLDGGAVMRSCDSSEIRAWSMGAGTSWGTAFSVIQAGVNTWGDAPPNNSLYGQSVARASWKLVIPGAAAAPSNADIDKTHVDDVVLKFAHRAPPRHSSPLGIDTSCLGSVGR